MDYQSIINEANRTLSETLAAQRQAEERQRAEEEKRGRSKAVVDGYIAALLKTSSLTGEYDANLVQFYTSNSPDPTQAYLGIAYDLLNHPLLGFRLGSNSLSFRGKTYDAIEGVKGIGWEVETILGAAPTTGNLWLHILLQSIAQGNPKTETVNMAAIWARYETPTLPPDIHIQDVDRLMRAGLMGF